MAIFIEDSHFLNGRLDWAILQNGWSCLYCSEDILEKDLDWFGKSDFKVIEIDCSDWTNSNSIHRSLSKRLSFPDYYGNNLDALNDCLSEVDIPGEGLIVVFKHFDVVQKAIGQSIADIFANNSRRHILFGRKLILLLQVSDRTFKMSNVGGSPILWNGTEFFITK
jgi:RNAse (barnase) inhibitor barstar